MKPELNRIRIGNQTAFSAASFLQPFEYAVDNGFDAFEWFPDKKESGAGWETGEISAETRRTIKNTARAHGIRLSVHAPRQANPMLPESAEPLEEAVRFAEDVGARLLNIHLDAGGGAAAFARALKPLLQRLAATGIRLAIENTPLTTPEDCNDLFRLLFSSAGAGLAVPPCSDAAARRPDAATVGMCLDLGHANLCQATRNDYLQFLDRLESQVPLIHIHLHENYGDADSHLPLFTGPAGRDPTGIEGFVQRLRERRFAGSIILEQWPQPPELLNAARNRLRDMIAKAFGPARPAAETPREPIVFSTDDSMAAAIVAADRQHPSWREKLLWLDRLLAEDRPAPSTGDLVDLAIYLRFLGTGEIPSAEDGGHYRPSHHARLARRIHERLSRLATPENVLIIRSIYPWLPSFNSAFTRAEPLTRIRDIAHRNDIPEELKREIKHTLQNKLHRCAGPEDLTVASDLLARITAPGAGYSPGFVTEFERFYAELQEFFNARSLEDQLTAIDERRSGDGTLIHEFLQAKKRAKTIGQQSAVLDLLTQLRGRLQRQQAGSGAAGQQELQIADIRLEDYAFVVVSRLYNRFEAAGEALPWAQVLTALTWTVENLHLSGLDEEECSAITVELRTWCAPFTAEERLPLLRLGATLDRCRRLAEAYCTRVLELFPDKVERLGRALGVAEHARRVFAEADIRRHLIFQLSKLTALALKAVRSRAGLPPWDVIVPGKAAGRLLAVPHLEQLPASPDSPPVAALLREAQGDEELARGIAALIVGHPIPHLSHLAVRARQAGVVLLAAENIERFDRLQAAAGGWLELDATADRVRLAVSAAGDRTGSSAAGRPPVRPDIAVTAVEPASGPGLLTLDQASPANAGSKAYGARRLSELARQPGADFATPPGVVIPFGILEQCWQGRSRQKERYDALIGRLDSLPRDDFEKALAELRAIFDHLELPGELTAAVQERFSPRQRLMVRSSSNCEDLAELAGAGLYESVANVAPAQAAAAIRKVWASLWTVRAALSRKELGIAHHEAHMAVLIQELITPQLAFILHTTNPVTGRSDQVYMELAVGLGETLASAKEPGVPFRLLYRTSDRRVETLHFASFSHALEPAPDGTLIRSTVDYSGIRLTIDDPFRERVAKRLGAIGKFVEQALGGPQDIEGLILDDVVYLVQARPQQGAG